MDTALFFYSILLTVAFALEAAAFALLYRQSRLLWQLWTAVMFGLFMADNLLYYTAEYLQAAALCPQLAAPHSLPVALLSAGCVLCYCRIAGEAAGRALPRRGGVGWALFLAGYAAAAPLAAAWPWAGAAHDLALTLVLAGAAALDLPRLAALPDARAGRAWKGLVWCTLALSAASQVENLLRMRGAWPAAPVGKAAGRKLALELLSLAFVACGGVYLARRLKAPAAGGDAQGAEKKLERYGREKGLTRREQEVLALVLRGEDGPRIARELYISPGTVKVHVHNILQKAGCRSRAELCRAVDETEP